MLTRFWNFTWQTNVDRKKLPPREQLEKFFNREALDAVFQYERGAELGKLHIQGMFTLDSKRTSKGRVLQLFAATFKNTFGLTISPTHSSISSQEYVTKTDGRVEGPYFCGKNEKFDSNFADMELSTWQKQIWDSLCSEEVKELAGRNIITIHDIKGKSGKSRFVKWLRVGQKQLTVRKLPVASVQQLNSAVYLISKSIEVDVYVIDITRSLGKDQNLQDLFSALEDVINGFVVDVMFGKYHEAIFKPPLIVIFTNYEFKELYPLMSPDRWIPLSLDPNKSLDHILYAPENPTQFTPFTHINAYKKK